MWFHTTCLSTMGCPPLHVIVGMGWMNFWKSNIGCNLGENPGTMHSIIEGVK